jgi:hypothetical protein
LHVGHTNTKTGIGEMAPLRFLDTASRGPGRYWEVCYAWSFLFQRRFRRKRHFLIAIFRGIC